MKNSSGNLARDSKGAMPRSTRQESKFWTLMVIKEPGSIFSFRVGKPFIVFLICLVLIALVFSVVSVVSYHMVSTENIVLQKDLDKVRSELLATSRAKDKALVRLMAFEGEGKSDEEEGSPSGKTHTSRIPDVTTGPRPTSANMKGTVSKEPEPVAKVSPIQPAKTGETDESVASQRISIEQLEIWKETESGSVKFQFMLKNIDPQGKKIRGFTFVVLNPVEEGAQGHLKVYPWAPLKDGTPTIFRKGQFFSIARIKSVRGTFSDIKTAERFKAATIFVFSETGSLLLKEEYELAEILRS